MGPQLQLLQQSLVGDARKPLLILLAAVAVVLLIACVNLASLTLARDDLRRRELAVRASLGASRARLIRQLLTEAAVSSLLAAVVGVLLATWGTDVLLHNMPAALPRVADVHVDGRVLLFTLLLALVTAALFGLGPALRAAVITPGATTVEGGRGSTNGVQRRRARRVLIVAELALALIPLAGAGVLLRSLDRLFSIELGYRTRQVLTADYALPQRTYGDAAQMAAYADRLIAGVRAVPGVISAGVITPAPLSGDNQSASFEIEGQPVPPAQETPWSQIRAASPDYFAATGIPLLRGRKFQAGDHADATRVALIDETFARRHFPNANPIGKRIVLGFDRAHPREIIGVVGAIRDEAPNKLHEPHIYFPFAQQTLSSATLVVRASGDARAVSVALRNAARTVDSNIPLYRLRTLQDAQREVLARSRFSALLFGLFALCALFMAAAGVYGVMSYWVAERRREIGIRLALGAGPDNIVRMIVAEGARLTICGLVLGLAGALAGGQLLATMLFETSAFDPVALASVTAILGTVALCACLGPAIRAARVDTLTVLVNG